MNSHVKIAFWEICKLFKLTMKLRRVVAKKHGARRKDGVAVPRWHLASRERTGHADASAGSTYWLHSPGGDQRASDGRILPAKRWWTDRERMDTQLKYYIFKHLVKVTEGVKKSWIAKQLWVWYSVQSTVDRESCRKVALKHGTNSKMHWKR